MLAHPGREVSVWRLVRWRGSGAYAVQWISQSQVLIEWLVPQLKVKKLGTYSLRWHLVAESAQVDP